MGTPIRPPVDDTRHTTRQTRKSDPRSTKRVRQARRRHGDLARRAA
ncbi:MAG: hypothetical protein AAF499_05200 [Pseudomonadota bacterium]